MSMEQAKAAIDRMKTDKVFNQEVMAISDPARRIEHLKKVGFECTEEEFIRLIDHDHDLRNDCPNTGMVINFDPNKVGLK
ncbi:MAG: Nif11-like leader peptide family natural product precursor [Prosthecochloris sp.]|uniref:Nif11 domain-containing protein n=1 Tax=Prosthecochloris aestuarii (strain DSM 271 / SK 413) TaxID=290512 RepID=B4S8S9_PROA2|nr:MULTISPECIES: Nif11-like leader peptide family RiPP precursor [Prosthecochloris]ACF46466.1 hypothetical protein Paes_1446 [Prosthecochloris aestuarii DSM 271]MCW8799027.1 Nif11-like leader peptide family natural product precursor [Prosthecochloris sp.]NEX11793.1 Nif11-like leader peptide family natural product precursor [Prosthecochloris sp.]RDD30026.1 Nif11-like leader peptide family natural product precursor [Prosthecochloris sp. ZM]